MENEITIPTFISKKYAVKHLEHLAEEQDEDSDNDAESNAEVSIDLHSTDFNLDENESIVDEEQVDVKEQAPVQAAVVPPTVDGKKLSWETFQRDDDVDWCLSFSNKGLDVRGPKWSPHVS